VKLVPEKIGRIEVRQVTRADLDLFYEEVKYPTVSGLIAILDGEPVALGGLAYVKGYVVAFFDIRDKARPYKLHLMARIKSLIDGAKERHKVIIAVPDENEPTSHKLLRSLGFQAPEDYDGAWKWVREIEDGSTGGGSRSSRQHLRDARRCAASTIAGRDGGLSGGGAEEGRRRRKGRRHSQGRTAAGRREKGLQQG
jgi:hypothetical protein